MPTFENPALPQGSRILVTGVNGYVGSHVADQALEYGYTVRGTVRNIQKHNWMLDFFGKKFGKGRFELAKVEDISKEGAFDEAVKSVSGVIHVASVVNMDPDPDRVIPVVVASTLGLLKSAAANEGVKRFVLTSSATTAAMPKPNDTSVITSDSYNEESVLLADNLPEELSDMQKGGIVYGASKVKGEQAMWKWVEDNRPNMIVNSVLPGGTFGKILSVENQGYPSITAMAYALYVDDQDSIPLFVKDYPPEWFVDAEDNARLHIAALLDKGVVNERIFAYAAPYNWNTVLREFRALFPDRKFMDDVPGIWDDLTTIERKDRAEDLLRKLGRTGFVSLRESLKLLAESS